MIIQIPCDMLAMSLTRSTKDISSLTEYAINRTAELEIVREQLADETVDAILGLPFATGEETEPTAEEKNIFKRFINWLRESAEEDQDDDETVEKDFSTFDSLNATRESNEKLWQYTSALTESIRSIQMDQNLDKSQKLELMEKSLGQFDTAMSSLFDALCSASQAGESALMVKSYDDDDDGDFEDDDF